MHLKPIRIFLLWVFVSLNLACPTGRPELRVLREMPAISEAVVVPETGRIYPSVIGSGEGVVVPDDAFALSKTLAEVRAAQAPKDQTIAVTISPGDTVDVLVLASDPLGLCLIRTREETYCWLSARCLNISDKS